MKAWEEAYRKYRYHGSGPTVAAHLATLETGHIVPDEEIRRAEIRHLIWRRDAWEVHIRGEQQELRKIDAALREVFQASAEQFITERRVP